MIDLHLHTTASDGLLAPAALVARARAAGLAIISVTDHDTVAGLAEAAEEAGRAGIRLVPGIEITAIERGRDVHVLGYFLDPDSAVLGGFLGAQRRERRGRVVAIAARLAGLGCPIDVERLLARATVAGRSIGRPAVADALVEAGFASGRDDAFERLLGAGRPAFVPRRGVPGAEVIRIIHQAGGIASLAHPGLLQMDDLLPVLAAAGLDAVEVWHSDHTAADEARYTEAADRLGLGRSGGSDFHGDGVHRGSRIGAVALPPSEFARLESRAGKG